MRQLGSELGFGDEPLGVGFRQQGLDGYLTIESQIDGGINTPHAPFGNLMRDVIVRDVWRIIGLRWQGRLGGLIRRCLNRLRGLR